MTRLLRLVCAHRVLVYERGRFVCHTCGAELPGHAPRGGGHVLLQRVRR
jgi:hypothetical protein